MDLLGRNKRPQVARAPNIIVHVPLDQPNVNFNFAALAEEKYGWDALHPIAARLRAINRLDSDDESDSEAAPHVVVEASGAANKGNNGSTLEQTVGSANNTDKKKRKRRKELENYDITDPFIDDDELVLQERTAASKDGFFVFQGPLVAEGETVRIEKLDGTQKRFAGRNARGGRTGRGRGGGPAKGARPKVGALSPEAIEPEMTTTDPSKPKSLPLNKDLPVKALHELPPRKPSTTTTPVPKTKKVELMTAPNTDAIMIDDTHLSSLKKMQHSVNPPLPKQVKQGTRLAIDSTKNPVMPSPNRTHTKSLSTPATAALKKNMPSEATLLRRAEMVAAQSAQKKAIALHSSPSPSTPSSPALNPDGSLKKPRKPVKEKTVEQKAELARRARVSRERKKKAREAEALAAAMKQATDSPMGLGGSSFGRHEESSSPYHSGVQGHHAHQSDVTRQMLQVKNETLGAPNAMQSRSRSDTHPTAASSTPRNTDSPGRGAMSVNALLD